MKKIKNIAVTVVMIFSCGESEIKPVEIFPEDECALCRMTVSSPAFASEIISQENEVFKFDDLSCLEQFRKKRSDVKISAIFLKDFDTKQWIPFETGIMILTGIKTPMGSGRIAVSSNNRAQELIKKFPVKDFNSKNWKDTP